MGEFLAWSGLFVVFVVPFVVGVILIIKFYY